MATVMSRYWINAPSALQPMHPLHGRRVLAPRRIFVGVVTVYFVDGPVTSQLAPVSCLSDGWPETALGGAASMGNHTYGHRVMRAVEEMQRLNCADEATFDITLLRTCNNHGVQTSDVVLQLHRQHTAGIRAERLEASCATL